MESACVQIARHFRHSVACFRRVGIRETLELFLSCRSAIIFLERYSVHRSLWLCSLLRRNLAHVVSASLRWSIHPTSAFALISTERRIGLPAQRLYCGEVLSNLALNMHLKKLMFIFCSLSTEVLCERERKRTVLANEEWKKWKSADATQVGVQDLVLVQDKRSKEINFYSSRFSKIGSAWKAWAWIVRDSGIMHGSIMSVTYHAGITKSQESDSRRVLPGACNLPVVKCCTGCCEMSSWRWSGSADGHGKFWKKWSPTFSKLTRPSTQHRVVKSHALCAGQALCPHQSFMKSDEKFMNGGTITCAHWQGEFRKSGV